MKTGNLAKMDYTLDDYLDKMTGSYKKDSKDFKVIESNTNNILAGNPAYKLIYTKAMEPENANIKTLEIGTIIASKVYFIRYYAPLQTYSIYLPDVQKMINSFEVTK